MANIVELREMSDDKLTEMLENGREELFNLRFQKAVARLDDYSRLKKVRRELAQVQTVLNMRRLAVQTAAAQPEIATALQGKQWHGSTRFDYEESAWLVTFTDEDDREIARAHVNLNKKRPSGRSQRRGQLQPDLVTSYEIVG